jgi:hypothetical protein
MSERVLRRRWQLATRLTVGALIWSIGLVLAALLVGSYTGQTVSSEAGVTLTTRTFVQVNGLRALVLVVIPTVACLAVATALWHRHRRRAPWGGPVAWTAIGVLTIEALLGIATVGLFMVPVIVLLVVSVRLVPGPAARPAPVPVSGTAPVDS